MISRIYDDLSSFIEPGRVLVIYGPRRVGKTTLIENFLKKSQLKYKLESGDNLRTQQILSSQDFSTILEFVEGYELLVIDEAQQIPNIGMGLKMLVDRRKDLQIVATGSSSFELSNQVGEPLTGRKRTLTLYPISQLELSKEQNNFELKERLNDFLVFGSYPEVLTSENKSQKKERLHELAQSYVLKDILSLENVKGSKTLFDLVKLLAFQIGKEVSYQELGRQIGLSVKTVQRYLDLLEKSFVIIRLGGFSRNLRNEVARKSKYYFYDTGLRNAVISQFNNLEDRSDVGELWENFLFVERLKKHAYQNMYVSPYFWRTYEGQEIDLIEEGDGKINAYEFKWSSKSRVSAPARWKETYPQASYETISSENYLSFIL